MLLPERVRRLPARFRDAAVDDTVEPGARKKLRSSSTSNRKAGTNLRKQNRQVAPATGGNLPHGLGGGAAGATGTASGAPPPPPHPTKDLDDSSDDDDVVLLRDFEDSDVEEISPEEFRRVLNEGASRTPGDAGEEADGGGGDDEDDEGDVRITATFGQVASRDLPHLRPDCGAHRFTPGLCVANSQHCRQCYCFVCDMPAADCVHWGTGARERDHANSRPLGYWRCLRKAARAGEHGLIDSEHWGSGPLGAATPQVASDDDDDVFCNFAILAAPGKWQPPSLLGRTGGGGQHRSQGAGGLAVPGGPQRPSELPAAHGATAINLGAAAAGSAAGDAATTEATPAAAAPAAAAAAGAAGVGAALVFETGSSNARQAWPAAAAPGMRPPAPRPPPPRQQRNLLPHEQQHREDMQRQRELVLQRHTQLLQRQRWPAERLRLQQQMAAAMASDSLQSQRHSDTSDSIVGVLPPYRSSSSGQSRGPQVGSGSGKGPNPLPRAMPLASVPAAGGSSSAWEQQAAAAGQRARQQQHKQRHPTQKRSKQGKPDMRGAPPQGGHQPQQNTSQHYQPQQMQVQPHRLESDR